MLCHGNLNREKDFSLKDATKPVETKSSKNIIEDLFVLLS